MLDRASALRLALAVPFLLPATSVAQEAVPNSGFEEGKTGWVEHRISFAPGTSFSQGTEGTAAPHAGAHASSISNHADGYLESEPVAVVPGLDYDVSAWTRGSIDPEGSEGAWSVRVVFYDPDGSALSHHDAASGQSGAVDRTWRQVGGRLRAPEGAATARLQLHLQQASGWIAYDDAELRIAPDGVNLLPNPGFEDGAGWAEKRLPSGAATSFWRSGWGMTTPRTGSSAYAISNQAYGFLQSDPIPVQGVTDYDVSAWVRGAVDPDTSQNAWLVKALFFDAAGALIGQQDAEYGLPRTLDLSWKRVGGRVTTPPGAVTLRLRLHLYFAFGWMAYDDVEVRRSPEGDNLVANPGFEDAGGWLEYRMPFAPGTAFWRGTWGMSAPRTGSFSYTISNQAYGHLESAPVAVTAGVAYDLTAWVRGEIDPDESHQGWLLRVAFYDASGAFISSKDTAGGTPGTLDATWRLVGGRVTPPAGAASLRVRLYLYQASGWIAWDDVRLVAVRADDTSGQSASPTPSVVTDLPPTAGFTIACHGLSCFFNASRSADDRGIASYAWAFGDATSGSGVTAGRHYATTGKYPVTLTVTDTQGQSSSSIRTVSVTNEAPLPAESYFTVPPCRIADTRATTPLTSGTQRTFQVTGLCGIPATAKAVSFNATVVSPTGGGHLVFLPGDQTSGPFLHSSLNFTPGSSPRANNAVLRLATDGAGTVRVRPFVAATPGQAHLILDVHGYFSEDVAPAPGAQGPLGFQTVSPCRIADTRTTGTPIATGASRSFTVQGACGVPAGAAAAALNPVVIGPTAGGHATLFQAGPPPGLPTINLNAGAVVANGVRNRLASTTPDVTMSYFSPVGGASTHALVDVYGYFRSDAPLKYRPITACRAADTRLAEEGGPALVAGQARRIQIGGNCGVPASAKAAAVNVTVVGPAGPGFLKVFASGSPPPAASYLNFDAAQGNLANGGIVALSTLTEDLAILSTGNIHVIVDVFGYFEEDDGAGSGAARDARFVTQSVPTTLVPGETRTVSVTVQNVGTETWTRAQNFRLGSTLPPPANTTWGPARILLEPGESVAPGQYKTFVFPITAPTTLGDYGFQWRMLQELVAWFGQSTPAVTITVTPRLIVEDLAGTQPQAPRENARGARRDHTFVAGEGIDFVDTASGNLMLSIPLGQVYRVGPILAYQLRTVYNSNVWDHIQLDCSPNCSPLKPGISEPNVNGNAGLGWELHFGKLYAPGPPEGIPWGLWPNRHHGHPENQGRRWLYVAPDGARHPLDPLPGRDAGTESRPVRYARDGSFIRMRQIGDSTIHIEHPDGRYSVFTRTGDERPGTEFCGSGVSGCWRFSEMRDRSGNFMRVTYLGAPNTETWRVTDSTGRQHEVRFDTTAEATGEERRVVTSVDVAAFGGTRAEYGFRYRVPPLLRGCPTDGSNVPENYRTIVTPILEGISVPESQDYVFETDSRADGTGNCDPLNGTITSVALPTGGRLEFAYGYWAFPTLCTYDYSDEQYLIEAQYSSPGVHRKTLHRSDGTVDGSWEYRSTLHPQNLELFGPDCTRANYRQTEVLAPAPAAGGKRTKQVFYHSVAEDVQHPQRNTPETTWRVTDNGLPYNKDVRIDAADGPLFLSSQTFDGCDANGNGCQLRRSSYLRYAMEWVPCNKLAGGVACYKANPTVQASRTVYEDDEGRFVETRRSDYDGAGHFRLVRTTDNFKGQRLVEDRTEYTATGGVRLDPDAYGYFPDSPEPRSYLPGIGAAWILHPFSLKARSENGRQYVTEHQFTDEGLMRCTRVRKDPSHRGPKDIVSRFEFGTAADNAGMPVTESTAGGEFSGQLRTDVACPPDAPATAGGRFDVEHTYQHLTLASTRVSGGDYPYTYRADIDPNTGLPAATYNVADQRTVHLYDRLGRLTRLEPEASLQEAVTDIQYANPAHAPAFIITRRIGAGGSVMSHSRTEHDGFGRPFRRIVKRAGGESESRTEYDALGRVSRASELRPLDAVGPSDWTVYANYDAFGRARRITYPDGQVETRAHWGVRLTETTRNVGGSQVTTQQVFDASGRLVQANNPVFRTQFDYDPYGQRVAARRLPAIGSTAQQRSFGYDARGHLLWESLPELGSNGANGFITYRPDVLGNPRRLTDGERDLTYEYDTAGRLTVVRDTAGGRLWVENSYAIANRIDNGNYRKGKLVKAVRHNYPLGGLNDWAVVETYAYRGRLGQLSTRTTQVQFPRNSGDDQYGVTFSQSWAYDTLGRLASTVYPTCVPIPQTGLNHCTDGPNDGPFPDLTVATTYAWEQPIAVSTGSAGISASLAYHGNLQLREITHGNGVRAVFDEGPRGLRRPTRIRFLHGTQTHYDSGLFSYDGAGNVTRIGTDVYTYDAAGRLLSGTVAQAGAGFREEYGYDAWDNVTRLRRDGGPWRSYLIDARSNRLLGDQANTPSEDMFYDAAGNMRRVGYTSGPGTAPAFEMNYDALKMQYEFVRNQPDGVRRQHLYVFGPGNYRLLTFDATTGVRTFSLRGRDGRTLRKFTVTGWGANGDPNGTPGGEAWQHLADLVYGPGGLLARRSAGGQVHYFHNDQLGSPRVITDASGAVRGRHHYYPFGAEVAPDANQEDEPSAKFTGHERDPHGLTDYMLGRTYAFPLMRFTSADPARDGWNLYAYVGNNPIRFVDPTGLLEEEAAEEEEQHLMLSYHFGGKARKSPTTARLSPFVDYGSSELELGWEVEVAFGVQRMQSPIVFRNTSGGVADVNLNAGLVGVRFGDKPADAGLRIGPRQSTNESLRFDESEVRLDALRGELVVPVAPFHNLAARLKVTDGRLTIDTRTEVGTALDARFRLLVRGGMAWGTMGPMGRTGPCPSQNCHVGLFELNPNVAPVPAH